MKDKAMTEKALGIPYKAWIKAGWTDELLLKCGYMIENSNRRKTV